MTDRMKHAVRADRTKDFGKEEKDILVVEALSLTPYRRDVPYLPRNRSGGKRYRHPPISASSTALGSLSSVALPSDWPARSVSKYGVHMPKIDQKITKSPLDRGSALIDD